MVYVRLLSDFIEVDFSETPFLDFQIETVELLSGLKAPCSPFLLKLLDGLVELEKARAMTDVDIFRNGAPVSVTLCAINQQEWPVTVGSFRNRFVVKPLGFRR